MTAVAAPVRSAALSTWCGWVVVAALSLVPLFGWLGPQGLALIAGVIGLLGLPSLRVAEEDRPAAVVLLVGLIWAAMSTAWSPFHPAKPGNNTALKLALELPLAWAAFCTARRADPRLQDLACKVLAWSGAVFGVLMLVEFATDAKVYETLHVRFYAPTRHDLAEVNVAHSTFVLALITPLAVAAAWRSRLNPWIVAVPAALGTVTAALRFRGEAPALAIVFAALVALVVWRWPRGGPRALAVSAVIYWLTAPLVILGVRAAGLYGTIQSRVELSWSMRMDYWRHATDWIRDHPVRGWGLDASRVFGPGIVLHPHDSALQFWLELGGVGAVLAAAFWWIVINRLRRDRRDPAAAAVAAACAVYLLFGALNFGAWQDWWLGLGALTAVCAALLLPNRELETST
jgi:O-antigen ligase